VSKAHHEMTLNRRTPRGKFVYKKVNKVRWRPSLSQTGHIYGSLFLSGSWDDTANNVTLWSWNGDDSGSAENENNFEVSKPVPAAAALEEPEMLAYFDHTLQGDVNDIQFLNPDFAVVASSSGTVTLLRLSRDIAPDCMSSGWVLQEATKWENLHSGGFSANAVASVSGENVASVGEDGKVFVLNAKYKQPIRVYEKADSCSLTSSIFAKSDQLVAGNMRGQLKIWDLRSRDDEPSVTCVLSNDQIGITCVTKHPTQSHILCTGSEDGMLAFWDLRKEKHPVTLLSAHAGAVSEVQFHAQQPDHMFSCSQNGEVLHWNGSNINNKPSSSIFGGHVTTTNVSCPWLNSEAVKNRVEVSNLMVKQPLPLNSLDSIGNSLLFGGDNEAVYVIPDILF